MEGQLVVALDSDILNTTHRRVIVRERRLHHADPALHTESERLVAALYRKSSLGRQCHHARLRVDKSIATRIGIRRYLVVTQPTPVRLADPVIAQLRRKPEPVAADPAH